MASDASNLKPLAAGIFFAAVGAFFSTSSYLTLEIGHLSAIGPGFFPFALGLVLILLGVGITMQVAGAAWSTFGTVSVRGILCLGLAPVLFSQTVLGLGMVVSVALTTLLACLSSRQMNVRVAAAVVALTTLVSVLIFHYLIALPVPLVGRWLSFGAV